MFLAASEKRACVSPLKVLSPGDIQLVAGWEKPARETGGCSGRSAGRTMIGEWINAARSFISFSKAPLGGGGKKVAKYLFKFLTPEFWFWGKKCLWRLEFSKIVTQAVKVTWRCLLRREHHLVLVSRYTFYHRMRRLSHIDESKNKHVLFFLV